MNAGRRRCCGTPRGHGGHKPDCPQVANVRGNAKKTAKLVRRVVEYEPPDGTVIRMRKMDGRWSASMRTPDGIEVEVDDGDRFWCLDLLDGRMVAAKHRLAFRGETPDAQ